MRKLTVIILLSLCGFVLLNHIGCGSEVSRPYIRGIVTDKSGVPIQRAEIRAVNSETNAQVITTTNSDGFYTTPELRAGTYRVTATAGSSTQENSIHVPPGDEGVTLNFALDR